MLSLLYALALPGVYAEIATGYPPYPGLGSNNPGFNITWPATTANFWPVTHYTYWYSNDTNYGTMDFDKVPADSYANATTWIPNWLWATLPNSTMMGKTAPVVWTWTDEFVDSHLPDNVNDTDWKLTLHLLRTTAEAEGGLSHVVTGALGPFDKSLSTCILDRTNYTATPQRAFSYSQKLDRTTFPSHTCAVDMTGSYYQRLNGTWMSILSDTEPGNGYFVALVNSTKGTYNPDGATYVSVSSLFSMKDTPFNQTQLNIKLNQPNFTIPDYADPARPKWLIDAPIVYTKNGTVVEMQYTNGTTVGNREETPWVPAPTASPTATATARSGATTLSASGMMAGVLALATVLLL